ncbi:MAG: ABC transporter ATP-binding protein [Dehalococcoidales bacterium]|jgi:ABC-2 type transport system ATP-binding protein|nr:ABC transporter ATP-binding protein [Dehalococcoidales bacterium]
MIEIKNLTKKFKSTLAVDDISLKISEGEVFGCLGHNGAGKTTTMRLILGLLRPTSGTAHVWEKPLSQNPHLRRKVGVLLENDGLYENLSGEDNLDYYARLYEIPDRKNRVSSLLEYTGLDTRRKDKVGTYSRGMRRKIGLARSILHYPSVLLLDEPSAGLDPEVQKMVRDLILNLAREQKILILLNSHDLDEVERICDRIAILQRGRVIACDSIKNLRSASSEPGVEIVLDGEEDPDMAVRVIESVEYVERIALANGKIRVVFKKGKSPDLLPALVNAGIRVSEISRTSRSLEDIYLEIIHREERQK